MRAASILIKPASANCNINCEYCFYKCLSSNREQYSLGFMKEETLEQLIKQAFAYVEAHVTFAFQGGEPTLAGLSFFRRVLELQQKYNTKGIHVENTIQTNGLLMDREWAEFLAKHQILVGLSLDGPRELHDRYRKDVQGNPTYDRVMETVALFEEYGVAYNILSVVTAHTCAHAKELYQFYREQYFPFVQLIPCMDEKQRQGKAGAQANAYAVEPEQYGHFLCEFFDLWYGDFMRSLKPSGEQKYGVMDVRMFSNLAQMAAGYPAEECGMSGCCTCYFVVEGDGSVYPCDFYCMDEWKLGTIADSFEDLLVSEKAKQFVAVSQPKHKKCAKCAHFSLCRGGCRRWREAQAGEEPALNQLCVAYKIFFAHTKGRILELGKLIRRRYGAYQR